MGRAPSIDALECRCLLSFAPFGGETVVPGIAVGLNLDVAVAGNGSFIVAAVVNNDPDSQAGDLVAVRYGADGQQIGDVILVASGVGAASFSVSADAVGNAVVAYGGTFFVLISNRGEVSDPVQANPDGGDGGVAVSMGDDGDFFMAWTGSGATIQSERPNFAQVRAFDAAGRPRGNAFTVITVTDSSVVYAGVYGLDISTTPDGSRAAVSVTDWSYSEVDTSSCDYYLVDTAGKLAGGSFYGYTEADDIAMNADGSFVVGLSDYGGSMNDEYRPSWVYAQRVDANGEKIGDPIKLSEGLPGPANPERETSGLSLAAMPDGGFVVSFVQSIENGSDLYARRYDASGVTDESDLLLLGGNARIPAIGVDRNGTTVVARLADDARTAQFRRLAIDDSFVQDSVLYVIGTDEDDVIDVSTEGSDIVVSRNDEISRFDLADVQAINVDGESGADTITNNTSLKSTLGGSEGSDTIFGGDGIDRLDGGDGDDSLWGGDSNDRIAGDDGKDFLYGNGGQDKIYGGLQGDFIRGNDGRDKLYGNGGNDRIYGGASADSIYGQGGNDQLFGEGGNDRIYSDYGTGSSTLRGGAGNDTFITANGLIDAIFGDGGHDIATADDIDLPTSIEELL